VARGVQGVYPIVMEVFEENSDFFEQIVKEKSKVKRAKLFRKATSAQLSAIANCILNFDYIPLSKTECKCVKRFLPAIRKFSKRVFTVKSLITFILRNQSLVVTVVSTILAKVLEKAISDICNYE